MTQKMNMAFALYDSSKDASQNSEEQNRYGGNSLMQNAPPYDREQEPLKGSCALALLFGHL
jgi:hypothetical protein